MPHLRVEGAAHAPQRGVWVVADGRVLDLLGVEVVIRLGEREGVVRGVDDPALGDCVHCEPFEPQHATA